MFPRTAGIPLGLLCLAVAGAGKRQVVADDAAQASKPAPLFTGKSLPLPPQQGKPWEPPKSKLSEKWVSAVQELVRYGFADPRGCEYREVKLTCGSSKWGRSHLTTTHAWVIPTIAGEKENSQRFAVTWDGLVYPVVEVGPPKDLKTDVETLIKESENGKGGPYDETLHAGGQISEFSFAYNCPNRMVGWSEDELVSNNSLLALKACLLSRLGEGQLAEQLWRAWKHRDSAILGVGPPGEDPYMVFAWEWAWAMFDRAVGAHLRGDDVVAMHAAGKLVPFSESVPRVAAQRGFHRLNRFMSNDLMPFVPLRDPPTRLLEESTRRVKAGPVRRALEIGLQKFPNQSQRIAALIRDLESISAGPEYEEGRWPLSPAHIVWTGGFGPPVNPLRVSPIVKALIKEGPPAIEPLLECFVNDRRLTRVAGRSGFDFLPGRDFIGVDLAAYAALCGILKADGFGPLTEEGYYHNCASWPDMEKRRAVAAEIRRRWERIKGRREEET